jgi:hypothetical protein
MTPVVPRVRCTADFALFGEDEVALSMLLAEWIVSAFIAAVISGMVRNLLWGGV